MGKMKITIEKDGKILSEATGEITLGMIAGDYDPDEDGTQQAMWIAGAAPSGFVGIYLANLVGGILERVGELDKVTFADKLGKVLNDQMTQLTPQDADEVPDEILEGIFRKGGVQRD